MSSNKAAAARHDFDSIVEGAAVSRDYVIAADTSQHFIAAFGDVSPLHVSDEYARAHGFAGKVAHGGILNGFISHFVGMHFPGEPAVLQSVDIQFKTPSHLNDVIRLEALVSQKIEAVRVIVLDIQFRNLTQGRLAARARVQVGVR